MPGDVTVGRAGRLILPGEKVYVAHQAVPGVMDIGNKARGEKRSIFPRHMATHQSFLNKDAL